MNSLALAFGLLTALPVRRLPAADRGAAGRAMLSAPLTAIPMLLVLAVAHLLVGWRLTPWVGAVLVLVAGALLNRVLHLDGLADTADGLAVRAKPGGTAERALSVMKSSDTGPAGVVALVLVLLVQAGALAPTLLSWSGSTLAGLGLLASRGAIAQSCRAGVPAASTTGLGALVAGSVSRLGAVLSAVLLAGVGVAAGLLPGLTWWHGPLVVVVTLLAGEAVVLVARRRLGGVTGDVFGAVVEVSLAAGLIAAALLSR